LNATLFLDVYIIPTGGLKSYNSVSYVVKK
jgi:hypothetical protein